MGIFDYFGYDPDTATSPAGKPFKSGYEQINEFLSSETYTKPAVDLGLDAVENLGNKIVTMTPYVFNRFIDNFPISLTEKNALKSAFALVKQRDFARRGGPQVKKRPNMAYGTRRKSAYPVRRRAYSKKSRKVYRKKPFSKRRSNASSTTMNLIWKAMKSRI